MKCEYCKKNPGSESRAMGVVCEDCYYKEANRQSQFDRYADEVELYDQEVA